jgi:hypothetical protein
MFIYLSLQSNLSTRILFRLLAGEPHDYGQAAGQHGPHVSPVLGFDGTTANLAAILLSKVIRATDGTTFAARPLVVMEASCISKTAVPRIFLVATRIEWETMAKQGFSAAGNGNCATHHQF